MDILSVTIDTRQVNRSGPRSLVFELELVAPPETQLGTAYGIRTVMEGCGGFQGHFHRGIGLSENEWFFMSCLERDLPAKFTVTRTFCGGRSR